VFSGPSRILIDAYDWFKHLSSFLLAVLLTTNSLIAFADELPTDKDADHVVEAGHSLHGEVFNEGPRQAQNCWRDRKGKTQNQLEKAGGSNLFQSRAGAT
jgi:hypothetical protein